jgi:hypothetical protein
LAWIVKIIGGGPEAEALKLIAHTHIQINKSKFPLDYVVDKDDNSEDGLLKKTSIKITQRRKYSDKSHYLQLCFINSRTT